MSKVIPFILALMVITSVCILGRAFASETPKAPEYFLVCNKEVSLVNSQVNRKLKAGWKLHKGPAVGGSTGYGRTICQAMVRFK